MLTKAYHLANDMSNGLTLVTTIEPLKKNGNNIFLNLYLYCLSCELITSSAVFIERISHNVDAKFWGNHFLYIQRIVRSNGYFLVLCDIINEYFVRIENRSGVV
jgi:hypothetical protein